MNRMICKEYHPGIDYSVVELGGARHIFAVATPSGGADFLKQAEDVLRTVKTALQDAGVSDSVVAQTIFLRDIKDMTVCREIVRDFYRHELPATTYIAQPPCDGKLLSIEAWAVGRGRDEVEIERLGDDMVLVRHDGVAWAHIANVRPEIFSGSVYDRSISAFHSANERLNQADLRFDDVIRTWLYLGDITGMEEQGDCPNFHVSKNGTVPFSTPGQTIRYRELNRARTDYYRDLNFSTGLLPPDWNRPVFPASTGIGVGGDDVAISCIAVQTNLPDVVLIPLENPRQTAAYDYAHQYGTESPKFSRAMAVVARELVVTFISGTASIISSETRHENDFQLQTQQTLDNIEALIAADNFREHGFPGIGATLNDLAAARIYIKRPEDYAQARSIFQKRLGNVPAIYVVADICRPELLVEIEGIALSRRQIG